MNNNVYIILLIFLIVYLIYKISSNSCDCFSVGIQRKDKYNCAYMNKSPVERIKELNNCSNYTYIQKWPDYLECNNVFYTNDIGINKMCKYDNMQCMSTDTDLPENLPNYYKNINCNKITLRPKNPEQLLTRLNEIYNTEGSNGVFVSMIFDLSSVWYNGLLYLDGSGSIIHKDIYTNFFGLYCTFGFIWDTDWLDKNLVDCLFPFDSATTPIKTCNTWCYDNKCFNSNIDGCKLANTSNDGLTPDRCSQGLLSYIDLKKKYDLGNQPYPTNCKQNIKYITDSDPPYREPIKNSSGCFNYIVDNLKNIKETYNEAVFLKDIDDDGIEINKGLAMLKYLNKPLPAALLFYTNDKYHSKCINLGYYKDMLDTFNSYFTPDTIVIIIIYNSMDYSDLEFLKYTTLGEMPEYVDPN